VLESAELFWISTVRADGRPHVTPLVAVWHDGALHFSTGPHEQKALNLVRSPAVVLTTGTNRWDRGLDVVVEGTARQITDDVALAELADIWSTKWDGRWQFRPVNAQPKAGSNTTLAGSPSCSECNQQRSWRSRRGTSATLGTCPERTSRSTDDRGAAGIDRRIARG